MLPGLPFRQQSRRERHELSSPDPPSPLDSGYASASPPSTTPKESVKENAWPLVDTQGHYDGSNSDSDDPFVDSDHENSLTNVAVALRNSPIPSRTRPALLRRAATVPRRTPRTRPALLPSYPLPVTRLQQRGSQAVSLRHLDRFIPPRHQGTELSERFKANKAPQELTAVERILRHSGATEDPFIYRRRIVTPLPETRSRTRAETAASRNEGEHDIAGLSGSAWH